MAELLAGNKIKLSSGQVINPQEGGWYDGRRWLGGQLLAPNESEPGKQVSSEVRAQSAAAQGVSVQQFDQYLSNVGAQNIQAPVTPAYSTGATQSYVTGLNAQTEAARKTLEERLLRDQEANKLASEEARKREQGALAEAEKLTTPFREDLEKKERERLGTETVLSEQRGLLNELDQLLTEGNELIRQQKDVTGLSAIRNPRVQKTMDDITARAGVIEAVVNLQNTYLSNAYQSIDRSANAIKDDRQDRLAYYDTILSLANRDIISLDAKSEKIAEEQVNLLKFDLEQATKTSDYIKELMINPDTAMLMAQGGVGLNDSIETINMKLTKAQYANEIRDLSNSMATSGYTVVSNPKSVPASQLVTITDSQGKKYYYRKSTSGTGFDSSSFLKGLTERGYKVSGAGTNTKDSQVNVDLIWDEVINNSVSTMAGMPNFSPAGGIGTTWTDSTGKKWRYTANGWAKV